MNRHWMRCLLAAGLMLQLSGCATEYQKSGMTGGFDETQLKDDIWRVRYAGNGFTTYETVQTYWLAHCADFALQKGYSGFQVLSDVRFTMDVPIEVFGDQDPMKKAHTVYTPIFVPGGGGGPKPQVMADVKFLHGDVASNPPKTFNAAALKARLDPLVSGKKCDNGNVCPHVHDYVYGTEADKS